MAIQLDWFYEKFPSNGGTGGRGLRRELAGAGLDVAQKSAREAVQNSIDAEVASDKPVAIRIRVASVSGKARQALLSELAFEGSDGPVKRTVLPAAIQDPLPVLYFEDFNTVGLGGVEDASRPRIPKLDRFVGLCRNFGDAAKDAEGGGTFGYGKAVYWNASGLHTVIFYSRIKPTGREDASSRLIGGSLFDQHDLDEVRFTGRAWLGDTGKADDYAAPLEDDAADAVAGRLGFSSRPSTAESGTSIMVLGSRFSDQQSLDALRRSVEDNYWPRMADDRLTVTFELDGQAAASPQPESRMELGPYLEAYKALKAGAQAGTNLLVKDLKTASGLKLGTLALVRLDASEQQALAERELSNRVALVRSPGMVVQYLPIAGRSTVGYVGVFKADPGFNSTLAKSEPPAHNLWDADTEDLSSSEADAIKSLDRQVRKNVREFLADQADNATDKPPSCPELGRALGRLFTVPGNGTTPPGTSDIRLRLIGNPVRESMDGSTFIRARFEIQADKRDGKSATRSKLRVSVTPRIAVEDGGRHKGRLPCKELTVKVGNVPKTAQETVTVHVGTGLFYALAEVLVGPLQHDEQTVAIQPEAILV